MSIIRVHKNENYTVMSNNHFKEKTMSLKAKGLMSLMLSLPIDWDFSIAGLTTLSSDGESAVRTALKELEKFGYLKRIPIREKTGKIIDWEYNLYEFPAFEQVVGNQQLGNQQLGNQAQLNTKEQKENKSIDLLQSPSTKSKSNLYIKCIAIINDFTEDEKLKNLLISYLKVRLEIKTKPLYANMWKGMITKLNSFPMHKWYDIVQQSIERGYLAFYDVTDHNNTVKSFKNKDNNISCQVINDEDARKLSEFTSNLHKQGRKRTEF